MREIKFRAWHIENKSMVNFDMESITSDPYQMAHFCDLASGKHKDGELMQFTGAFDSCMNELYIDDLVNVSDHGVCIVSMCTWYGVTFTDDIGHEIAMIDCLAENDEIKLVGNIHQNKELLK